MYRVFLFLFLVAIVMTFAQNPDPQAIIRQCIEKHGGWKKFSEIRDIYAKMDMVAYSEENKIEFTLHEYFRKPDKLRVEMYSDANPPVIMGWDGKTVRQLDKDGKIDSSQQQDSVGKIQESLRFIRLMILTNLLTDDSQIEYVKLQKRDDGNIHIISQAPKNGQGEKAFLLIADKTYTLLGAQFAMKNNSNGKDTFIVKFKQHEWYKEMYLPMQIDMYVQNKLAMEIQLRWAKINTLENGNSFFSDLLEKPKVTKTDSNIRRN